MDSNWDQVIVSHEEKNVKSPDHIKQEDVNNNNSEIKEDSETGPSDGPQSPSYLPQYKKSISTKSSNSKIDKRYKYNPKPLGKKTNRSFVPEESKTEDYWQKRIKNNVAARKSREDRRKKEIEMVGKKSQYEKENLQLRLFIEKMQSENQYLLYEINFLREGKGYSKF